MPYPSFSGASLRAYGVLVMIYEFDSRKALHEAWESNPGLCGPSPGGAAGALGISRQAVHAAVKRGSLDMVRLKEPGGKGPYLYITQASIERHRKKGGRPGPAPGFRQRAVHEVDRLFRGVWPR